MLDNFAYKTDKLNQKDTLLKIRREQRVKRIVNSIISVILAISMVLCTNLINVNAQERSTQLSKGQYLIINSKKNKLGYFKDGVLVK